MTLTRIQASDFQDAGVKGNLSKLEIIAKYAQKTNARFDNVGDTFDTHIIEDYLKLGGGKNTEQLLKSNPAAKAKKEEMEKFSAELDKKYASHPDQIVEADLAKIQKMNQELMKMGYFQAQAKDLTPALRDFYKQVAKIISPLKGRTFIIRGNNDAAFMPEEVQGVTYPELGDKMVEDGPFRIIGFNNIDQAAQPLMPYGAAFESDSTNLYQKYNLKRTGKRANIIMMHNPPMGREGEEGLQKLIAEHIPETGVLLVEAGHTHSFELSFQKNKTGNGGVVIAVSSPNYFFEHKFDDNGNYKSTDIYRYK